MSPSEGRQDRWRKLSASLIVSLLLLSTIVIVSTAPEGVEARAGIFQTEGGWSVEVVDGEGITGVQSSLAIDDLGYAHIAYRNDEDSTLKYANNADGFWNITTVDHEISLDCEISLDLDSENKVHISYMSYYNDEDENLVYATNAGGSWTTTVIDTHYLAGYYNDIFVDGADNVHIAYSVQNEGWDTDLKYANNTAGTWANETADSGTEVGMHPSIVVDEYGIIHIVYFNQDAVSLMWGHKHPSGWFRSPLDDSGDCGYYTSMDISDGSDLHVSYFDEGADNLKYLHFDGIQWDLSPTVVDSAGDVGRYSSICVGNDNDPHIAYYDSDNYALKVASLQDGGWNCSTVDDAGSSSVGEYCSIAMSRDGKLGVSNYFSGSDDLLYTSQNAWIIDKLAGGMDNRCVGNTDIVLDDDNKAYISYTANAEYELWFATNSMGSWTYTMIDNTTGGFGGRTSIARAPNGQVHIAYYAADSGEIRHATKVGMNPWTWEKVADTRPNWGSNDLSMKVDSNGKVHIAYSFFEDDGFTSSLRYANNTGGSWVNETIDDSSADIGRYPSLAINPDDKVYISYVDMTNKDLRCISKIAGSWSPWTIDPSSDVGDQTSIFIDIAGRMHISYMDVTNHDLKYAYYNGGTWLTYTVDTLGWVGEDSSIGVDSDGKVHISYSDTGNSDLKYAIGSGSTWSVTVLDYEGSVGEESSLAIGTDDKVHIAYEDGTNTQIGYATNSPWSFRTIYDLGDVTASSNYLSMVKDAQGAYHICFYDVDDSALRYSTNKDGLLTTVLVDNDAEVGEHCSIDVDLNGKAHISYYDKTDGNLKYATNAAGGGFVKTIVDATGTVGQYTSIAVDALGKAHISYLDSTNEALKYATNSGGSWTNVTVDDTGITGLYTDIALDSDGNVHISYYTGTVGLRYANNTAGSWNAITVDAGNTGLFTSIALDSQDRAHISYYEPLNQDLRYAVIDGSSVTKELVDSSAFGFMARSSIDIDVTGQPHIGYYSEIDGNLRYAAKAGDFWWTTTVDVEGDVGKPNSLHVNEWGVVTICYLDVTDSKVKIATQNAEPSAPRDLSLTTDLGSVSASWSEPAYDNGYPVEGYIIVHTYPDGEVELIFGGMSTSRLDNSLEEGVHRYKVAAYNLLGTGPFCAEEEVIVDLTPHTAPSAPTGLTATAGDGNVSLEWAAPSSDGGLSITNYSVYRGVTPGGESFLTSIGPVLTYLDESVTNGQTYYYKVSAVNAYDEGELSNEASATPSAILTVPGAPTGIEAIPHDGMVEVNWEAPIDDGGSSITGYKVYRGSSSGALTAWSTLGNVLTWSDHSVENGNTYYYAISAVNAQGEGPLSAEVSAKPARLPSAPMNLTATLDGDDVILAWEAPEDDGGSPVTNYTIYAGTISGDLEFLQRIGNLLTYTYALPPNTTFFFQVTATNGVGEGPKSNEVSSNPALPTAPALFAEADGGSVILTWTPPASNGSSPISAYQVFRGNVSGTLVKIADLGNVLTYQDDDVETGSTYYYKVRAVNDQGEGPFSNEVSASIGSLPSSPNGLEASAEGAGIVLTWEAPEDDGGWAVTSYKVYRGTSAGNLTLKTALGAVLNYTDYDVVAGITYYYAVRAVNQIGEGNASSVVSAEANSLPSAPSGLDVEAGDGAVTLSWNAPAEDGGAPITGYRIYRGTSPGALTLLATVGNVTTYTDSGVTNGQKYYYEVSAVNAVGEGPSTVAVDATPAAEEEGGDGGMMLMIIALVAVAAAAGVGVFFLRKKK